MASLEAAAVLKWRGGDLADRHRHLHHDANQRFVKAEPGHRPDHAFVADGRGLDRLAVAQYGEQRQHPVMREVHLIDFVAGFVQHDALLQGYRRQIRKQPVEVVTRQRGEQLVVQGKTDFKSGDCHCDILPGRSGRCTAGMNGRSERAIRGKCLI